jgi:hypothetical protein
MGIAQSHIWGGGATGGDVTGSMFCACPDFSHVFFLTIVVLNVVQVTWLLCHMTPMGVPLEGCVHAQSEVAQSLP